MPGQFHGASDMRFRGGNFIDVGRDYNHTDNSYRPENSHNGNFNLGSGNGTSRGNGITIGTEAAESPPWVNEQAETAGSEADDDVASNIPNEVLLGLVQKLQNGGYNELEPAQMRAVLASLRRQLSPNDRQALRNEVVDPFQGADIGTPLMAIEARPQTISPITSNNTPVYSPSPHPSTPSPSSLGSLQNSARQECL